MGDKAAFGELVRRHQQRIHRLAVHMLRDRAEAEDVTQETFIRAFQALARFDGRSEAYTWFYRITINLSLNRIRSRKTSRATHDTDDPRLDGVLDGQAAGDLRSGRLGATPGALPRAVSGHRPAQRDAPYDAHPRLHRRAIPRGRLVDPGCPGRHDRMAHPRSAAQAEGVSERPGLRPRGRWDVSETPKKLSLDAALREWPELEKSRDGLGRNGPAHRRARAARERLARPLRTSRMKIYSRSPLDKSKGKVITPPRQ